MNDEVDNLDIDSLLDAELDDLEDLPEFKPFVPGAHKMYVTLELKEIAGHPSVEMAMKAIETMELENPSDEALKEGDETSALFMLDNEFGRGKFKAVAAAFAEFAGSRNNRAIIEAVTDVECLVVTTQRPDKKDPDKVYTNPKEIAVL